MSVVCLGFISILYLFCTTQAEKVGNNEVIWRHVGGSVSIQCRVAQQTTTMTLNKGLKKDISVLNLYEGEKETINQDFNGRLHVEGAFPTVTVHISNLTVEDTGPYWCGYEWFDNEKFEQHKAAGEGSVLLVITEVEVDKQPCDKSLLLVTVVVSAAVLFGVAVAFLLWIIPKIRRWHATYKMDDGASSDLYEDMRGRLRS
ncbi:uncharacterized protein si:rp71-81e14.2 isoform X2 [Corythoichthys intestinalis]|uniref:uncharacterized protein si:rp71-81e14.2 isoform X2 n=1 Tax=Corythoichthys intestinalis TaxID=161448 RepID=UPI0025A4D811|nr:uncharacterized protein si:rp71-81e14.2 isoform X2 [Corythoichthys intestinalis]